MPVTITPVSSAITQFKDTLTAPLDDESYEAHGFGLPSSFPLSINQMFQTTLSDAVALKSGTYDGFRFASPTGNAPLYQWQVGNNDSVPPAPGNPAVFDTVYYNNYTNLHITSSDGKTIWIAPQQALVVSGTGFVLSGATTLTSSSLVTSSSNIGLLSGTFQPDTWYNVMAHNTTGSLQFYITDNFLYNFPYSGSVQINIISGLTASVFWNPDWSDMFVQTIRTDNSGNIIPFTRTGNRTRLLKQYSGLYLLNQVSGTDTAYHPIDNFNRLAIPQTNTGSLGTFMGTFTAPHAEAYVLFRLNSVSASSQVTIAAPTAFGAVSSNNQIIAYLNSGITNSGSVIPQFMGSIQVWLPMHQIPPTSLYGPQTQDWEFAFQSIVGNQTLDAIVMGWSEQNLYF